MVDQNYKHNARHLKAELDWFRRVVETRYKLHHGQPCAYKDIADIAPPPLNGCPSIYQRFVEHCRLTWQERLVLALALMPHIKPHALDDLLVSIDPQFGAKSPATGNPDIQTTIETALFLLAGDDLEKRFLYQQMFDPDAVLLREDILRLEYDSRHPGNTHARLTIAPEFLSLFTSGKEAKPDFNEAFPAKRITTRQAWSDLVLNHKTRGQINEIKSWIQHGNTLLYEWGLIHKFAPGYTCLFHGPPGTGKTMTATLLGKFSETDVYRIDMAMVVSRYVGDTSKNLGRIFDVARNKPWLLFFDECESCFSKRSDTIKDAHDRWSNQEISYLLQRIDDHPGTVILATNMKQHVDDAFLRRFQNVIEFSMPSKHERLLIWKKGFSKRCVLEEAIDLEQIADKYEMAGGAIMNVIRYASLMALEHGSNVVLLEDLLRGIQREFIKEGRSR